MNTTQLAFLLGASLFVVAVLFAGTFFLLFLERLLFARTQHRDGPGRGGRMDVWQVWTDFLKVRRKSGDSTADLPTRFQVALYFWMILPVVFLLVLFSPLIPARLAESEMPLLLLLPLLAAGAEAIFMHMTIDFTELYEWRKRLMLRILGTSALYLAVLAVVFRLGGFSLAAVSGLQETFPYFTIFANPGLCLCGIGAFMSIFLYVAESPVESRAELSLHGSLQYLIFFVNKMWIFCLISFWVVVFFGGTGSLLAMITLPFKVAGALFLFVLLQSSFPKIRSSDAAEMTARWLLPLCLVGLSLEVIWMGAFP